MIWHLFLKWWVMPIVTPLNDWWQRRHYSKIPPEYWTEQERKWAEYRSSKGQM